MSQAHTTGKVLAGTVGAVGLLLATGQAANAASVTVKANDTVWGLAQEHGVSVKSIEKLNKIKALNATTDLIYVGQKIQINGSTKDAQAATQTGSTQSNTTAEGTYTVKAGDTLWTLADQFHTSVHALQTLNGLSGDLIVTGQTLKVPGTTTTASTPAAASTKGTTSTPASASSTPTKQVVGTTANVSSATTVSATSQAPSASSQTTTTNSTATSQATSTTAVSQDATSASATTNSTSVASATTNNTATASTATSQASASSATSTASAASTSTANQPVQAEAYAYKLTATSASTTQTSATATSASQSSSSTATQGQNQNTTATSASSQATSSAAQSTSSVATSTASQSSSSAATSTATSTASQSSSTAATNSNSTTTTSNSDLSTGSVTGLAVKLANANIPYIYGGASLSGMDCSGLVSYVYQHAAGITLPHNTVAQEGYVTVKSVASAQPGDILFWGERGHSYHDAIYIGNNQYVAAPQPGQNVDIETINASFMPSFAGSVNR